MATTDIVKPMRKSFRYMEGLGRRPTAYEEATYRLQPVEHFHYRPLWNPSTQIFDPSLTKVTSSDWESFQDPDKLYYATYCYSRADWESRIAETFDQAQRLGLWNQISPEFLPVLKDVVVPLRHVHYGEMITLTYVSRFAYGTAIEQAATYQAYDHMGAAQLITRMAKELEDQEPAILTESRSQWLNAPHLQPLRRLVEEQMAITDWMEAVVATTLTLDVCLHELVYAALGTTAVAGGATVYGLMADHLLKFSGYGRRWSLALVKNLLKENPDHNRPVLQTYVDTWLPEALAAVEPLARELEAAGVLPKGVGLNDQVSPAVRDLLAGIGLVATGV